MKWASRRIGTNGWRVVIGNSQHGAMVLPVRPATGGQVGFGGHECGWSQVAPTENKKHEAGEHSRHEHS